jgi:hypothetical protein
MNCMCSTLEAFLSGFDLFLYSAIHGLTSEFAAPQIEKIAHWTIAVRRECSHPKASMFVFKYYSGNFD